MDAPKPMVISNPRRMLVIGAPDSSVLEFLKDLTNTAPPPPVPSSTDNADTTDTGPSTDSVAGLTHAWTLTTPYYTTTIPIWIDEIAALDAWRRDFCAAEAREVVAAVGAWVYVFTKPLSSSKAENEDAKKEREHVLATMKAVQEVVEKGAGLGWDGVCLAVGVAGRQGRLVGTSDVVVGGEEGKEEGGGLGVEEWEDAARERGFEYVDAEKEGRNEFGEVQGIARVKEALEANEWEGDEGAGVSDFEDLEGSGDEEDWGKTFAAEEAEMGMELLGLKTELNGGGGNDEDEAAQVDELERMMSKLGGIRDLAAGMPEEQRKKFAAKAVSDLMKSP